MVLERPPPGADGGAGPGGGGRRLHQRCRSLSELRAAGETAGAAAPEPPSASAEGGGDPFKGYNLTALTHRSGGTRSLRELRSLLAAALEEEEEDEEQEPGSPPPRPPPGGATCPLARQRPPALRRSLSLRDLPGVECVAANREGDGAAAPRAATDGGEMGSSGAEGSGLSAHGSDVAGSAQGAGRGPPGGAPALEACRRAEASQVASRSSPRRGVGLPRGFAVQHGRQGSPWAVPAPAKEGACNKSLEDIWNSINRVPHTVSGDPASVASGPVPLPAIRTRPPGGDGRGAARPGNADGDASPVAHLLAGRSDLMRHIFQQQQQLVSDGFCFPCVGAAGSRWEDELSSPDMSPKMFIGQRAARGPAAHGAA